jgi:hypothetical protein
MSWREDLHPRDEYGRFRLRGAGGIMDRVAGALINARHQKVIDEHEALWQKQFKYYQPLQKSGQLTPELDAQWDRDIERRDALQRQLPEAHKRGLVPHSDGTWRPPKGGNEFNAYDEKGRRLPPMAVLGAVRVGDSPSGPPHSGLTDRELSDFYQDEDDALVRISPLWGGAWHRSGDYGPGRVPVLRDDMGFAITDLRPAPKKSKRHRDFSSAFWRAELRGEQVGARSVVMKVGNKYIQRERESPEVAGAQMISPLNPTSRRRSARVKRKREQTVTWIQRVNQRMEEGR